MAMTEYSLGILKQMIALSPKQPVKMVALGYPDVLLTEAVIRTHIGDEAWGSLKYRADSADIVRWHGLSKYIEKVPDPHDLLRHLGVELSVVDLREIRGGEIVCDLNFPLSDEFKNSFDVVFDGGTMEHCFNVAQAIQNILEMAKVGGYIYHSNPITMVNHGFYNFSPTFYYDFYVQNGHEIVSPFAAISGNALHTKVQDLDATQRTVDTPDNAVVSVVARKLNGDKTKFPTQSKYLNSPDLKNTAT